MMIDLGKKSGGTECCKPIEDKKEKKYYPTLYIDTKSIEIPKSSFDKDIEIKAIIRVKSQTIRKDDNGTTSGSIDLEVRKIDFGVEEKSIRESMMDTLEDEDEK